jgi:SAM-dependent methyltransferase
MARRTAVGIRLGGALIGLLPLLAAATPAAAQPDSVQTARIRENNAREGSQRVPDILVALNVAPGAHVADVGAGDGFFTVRLARAVGPSGRVIAEDVDARALARLRAHAAEDQLDNVDVVQGDVADPHLPTGTLDAVLVVNAYHEMEQFASMLGHLRRALKPGGRLVLVEPLDPRLRGESRSRQTKDHSLDAGFAVRELRAARFDVVGLRDPFIRRGSGSEQWLLIAERGPDSDPAQAAAALAGPATATDSPVTFGTEAELASPDLRVSVARLNALLGSGPVLVLDVRNADGYVDGHLPGAILVPLGDLAERLPELRREDRPIVAYCT